MKPFEWRPKRPWGYETQLKEGREDVNRNEEVCRGMAAVFRNVQKVEQHPQKLSKVQHKKAVEVCNAMKCDQKRET